MPAAAEAAPPPVRRVEQRDTHRLIPAKYSEHGDSVLVRIADDDAHLGEIFDLDSATNDRLLAENNLRPGIGLHELVSGFPNYRIVNAAFTHPHPLGSRFNGPDRGAWYAGFELETAHAEIAWHKTIELAEIGWFDESVTYDDYLADFTADFHELRGAAPLKECLDPRSYEASQELGARLLGSGSLG
ncbi:MAG: RES family NAD+ phosphorylase, partial [Alphaproteobacteria bacterium]